MRTILGAMALATASLTLVEARAEGEQGLQLQSEGFAAVQFQSLRLVLEPHVGQKSVEPGG
jgi:hypothetical protein